MTLREYVEANSEAVVAELCQYQQCDNCSIGSLFEERCALVLSPIDEAMDAEIKEESK